MLGTFVHRERTLTLSVFQYVDKKKEKEPIACFSSAALQDETVQFLSVRFLASRQAA